MTKLLYHNKASIDLAYKEAKQLEIKKIIETIQQ